MPSHKAFKAFPGRLADGAYFRRGLADAKVTADAAAPDGQRQVRKDGCGGGGRILRAGGAARRAARW